MEFLNLSQKIYFIVVIGFIGLSVGSFLNVVALRLLSEEDFIKGRSKCPKCGNIIAWYDNIPLLSYILLLGKCRKCGEKISLLYPFVELLTGLLFIATVWVFGFTLKTVFLLILVCNLIVITITDLKEKYIFDINSIPLIPLGLIYNFFDIGAGAYKFAGFHLSDVFISAVIGAIVGAAFFEIFSRIGLLIAGEYAFGAGDSILGAALGAWFGWKFFIIILILSFLSQMVIGIPIVIYNMYKSKDVKSLWAMGTLLISLMLTFLGKYYTAHGNPFMALSVVLLSFVIAGAAVFVILKNARERQSYTFLPFGPSLVFGGFMVLFFSAELLKFFPY